MPLSALESGATHIVFGSYFTSHFFSFIKRFERMQMIQTKVVSKYLCSDLAIEGT